jgi:hypothetical protein
LAAYKRGRYRRVIKQFNARRGRKISSRIVINNKDRVINIEDIIVVKM